VIKTASLLQPGPFEGSSESQPRQVTSLERQHVALKVENAHRKLNLWNPADIIISELHSSIHSSKPYLPDLEQIVRGNPEKNIRAGICRSVCETIQEQVDCLIDQATDPNLLGRIWVGWQPWL
jgi:DNA-dependent protein kinase catalytic subunit